MGVFAANLDTLTEIASDISSVAKKLESNAGSLNIAGTNLTEAFSGKGSDSLKNALSCLSENNTTLASNLTTLKGQLESFAQDVKDMETDIGTIFPGQS
jgi:uncharacterized protein YukE